MQVLQEVRSFKHNGSGRDLFRVPDAEWNDWRWQIEHRLRGEAGLERIPGLGTAERAGIRRVLQRYPWSVTPYLFSLVQWENPEDPVRKQFLPDPREGSDADGGCPDPLKEREHTIVPGLIQRYPDRAVLLSTNECVAHCRHCFRKRLWLEPLCRYDPDQWERVLSHLRSDPSIRDVLISGGDPLTLPDETLEELLHDIRSIPHVEIIRIGTRIPVVLPQRITSGLCRLLDAYGPVWLITQFNHPQEITGESAAACRRLLRAGVPVNNQSVLLRGINDDPRTMKRLCRELLRIRVRPYYLHQCDPVSGTKHFRTPVEKGIEIIRELQGSITGLAVPRFMVDLPGKGGKVPLQPDYVVSRCKGEILLLSHTGEIVSYEDP